MAKFTEDDIRKNAEAMLSEMEKADLKRPRAEKPGSNMPSYMPSYKVPKYLVAEEAGNKKPRAEKPGSNMPSYKVPKYLVAEKAGNKKELDAKIKTNQPSSKPSAPPGGPKPPAKLRPGVDVPHTDDGFRRNPNTDDDVYTTMPVRMPPPPPGSPKPPVGLRPGIDVPHTDDGFRRNPIVDSPYIGIPKGPTAPGGPSSGRGSGTIPDEVLKKLKGSTLKMRPDGMPEGFGKPANAKPASDFDKMQLAKQAEMSKLPPTMASNAYQPSAKPAYSGPVPQTPAPSRMGRMGQKPSMPQPTSMGEMGGGGGYGESGFGGMKRGGKVRKKSEAKFSSGGSTSKASSRGDGIAQRGKTKGRYI